MQSTIYGAAGGRSGYLIGSLGKQTLRNPTQRYIRNYIPVAFPKGKNYGTLGGLTGAILGGHIGNQ